MSPETPASRPRRRRRWLLFFGGACLGGAFLVGVLLIPGVQRRIVRQIVARQAGWRVDFETFGVSPSGLEARGLDFAMPGLTAKSELIAVQLLPARLLRGEIHVAQIDVARLRIELTPAQLAAPARTTSAAPTGVPFPGLLALLRAPLPWAVQQTNADIEVAVNDGGRSVVVARLGLRGGGLRAGHTGEFTYEFSAASALLPAGPDQVVKSRGTLRVTPNTTHGLDHIELQGDLSLPRYGGLALPGGTFALTLHATPAGENYTAALRLGTGATCNFRGELDRSRARIDGTLDFRLDQSLAASVLPNAPTASLVGKMVLGFDLRANALEATLDGDLSLQDFARLRPELVPVDALGGKLTAAFAWRQGRGELRRAALTLRGATSPLALEAALTSPLALPFVATAVKGRVAVAGLPAAWANPWLGGAVEITQGAFSAEWTLAFDADQTLHLEAARPVEFGPIAAVSPRLPKIPPLTLRFSPRLTASREHIAFTCDDLALTSPDGDRVTLEMAASQDAKTNTTRFSGRVAGELPTLLASPQHALPFVVGARWEASATPDRVHVESLALTARRAEAAVPALSLALLRPIDFAGPGETLRDRDVDLLQLEVHDLPLAWISRWLHTAELSGTWSAGESALRRTATGRGLVLGTRVPWKLSGVGVTVGGKSFFEGGAQLAPEFAFDETRLSARLAQLELADTAGNRVGGEATFAWHRADKKFSGALALDAALPALPGSRDTFGPLTARLRAQASSLEANVSQVESFQLEVQRADGPLFTVNAPQPFLVTQKPNGEFIAQSVAPLTVDVARLPLAWLQPWLPEDVALTGTVEPAKFLLVAEPQNFFLRATQPVGVSDLSYVRGGVPRVQAARGAFYPGADLRLFHELQPKFKLAYQGRLHATDGALDVAGARAIDFEGSLGFLGNDQGVLPDGGDVALRVDFGALHRVPLLAENGVPAAGEFAFRANGNLHDDPPEFWARLSGVPSRDGKRILPPLELSGRGRVNAETRSIRFNVEALLATQPKPSDATFQLEVSSWRNSVPVTSTLESRFFDVGEALALASAFSPPRARPVSTPATPPGTTAADTPSPAPSSPLAPTPAYAPLGAPFWGRLRGRFELKLDTIAMAPYRIDGVRGRLELTPRTLALSDLAGEMFAGRWRGGVRVDYDPAAQENDHALSGDFHIQQFETARAIQTVFPNEFGSLDTRLDLDASLRGAGSRWWELLDRAQGEFSVDAHDGVARLTHPQLGTATTVLALAGTLTFSPEMRALGRLLKQFAELPIQRLHVSGARDAAGDLVLREFRLESPQTRLLGHGRVPAVAGVPLAGRKLDLAIELTARDEMATLLGNMKLLEKTPQPDGYLRMKQPFAIGGEVGQPDPSPLYEMLARAVDGSSGSWGLIMRKVQKEIEKKAATTAPKKTAVTR